MPRRTLNLSTILFAALLLTLAGVVQARFEWRDIVQNVDILPDGTVIVDDVRTLWTDEDFGEAFICFALTGDQRIELLEGSGAVSPGTPAIAFSQPCAGGTELVIRNEQRVSERRVRFVYRMSGTVDVFGDVVQWYWNMIRFDHPVILGYTLTVRAPGPMEPPFAAFVHRFSNPELPKVTLSETRDVLKVSFDRIPDGDGVEIRYLMDPALFTIQGSESAFLRLLEDEARIVGQRSSMGEKALLGRQAPGGPAVGGQEAGTEMDLQGTASGTIVAEAERLLAQGSSGQAEALLGQHLSENPEDAQARFALGGVQALVAVEKLTQDAYRFGLGSGSAGEMGLLFGLEVPVNPSPERVGHEDLRAMLERFHDRLVEAEETLAPLAALAGSEAGTELTLRLELGRIRLDFNGDGIPGEQLSAVLFELRNLTTFDRQGTADQPIPIDFDLGDALWLRGYLHLLAATVDAILAYDAQTLWDATAQLFFAFPETPYSYLAQPAAPDFEGFDLALIADAIAVVHLIDLPVAEPERLAEALTHLEATVALSRDSWDAILAETDDGREWLPNPRQTGVVPTRPGGPPLAVTDAMIDNWFALLDETEAILAGRKLVPYWRVTDGRGLNLRRVFLEPRPFDLVLWLQGAAVAPYLETGERTRGETWQRIVQAFGGRFTPFVFWFN